MTALAGLYVLAPRTGLVVSLFGGPVFEQFYPFRNEPQEIRRRLAYDLDRFWIANDRIIGRMAVAVWVSILALAAELVLLVIAVGDTIL